MTTQQPTIIQVAVPAPLRRSFDYEADQPLAPGTRVLVPFGRRQLVGIVLSCNAADEARKLKRIIRTLDSAPVFTPNLFSLLIWASGYYHHPVGEVMAGAMPVLLRSADEVAKPQGRRFYRSIAGTTAQSTLKNAPSQASLYHLLAGDQWVSEQDIGQQLPGWRNALKGLEAKALVQSRSMYEAAAVSAGQQNIDLNAEQITAADQLIASEGSYNAFLLQGITGSGKTEVYLAAARRCIEQGKQVLFLVPEIALTPQLVSRVAQQLGTTVHTLHSGMTNRARYETWWMAGQGYAKAILGTRSAVFSPLINPGLIIVDEEHDQSYKQQDGFRYHARDLAIKRASLEQVPVVLGSATPSLESLHNVSTGRYRRLVLNQRFGEARLPHISTIDIGAHTPLNGLTQPVYEAIGHRLQRNEQVIVYINRRGYAPVVHCYHCQWQATCDRCDAKLTYHQKRHQLRCHHCGFTRPGEDNCPKCEMPLYFAGAGTQRIEMALQGKFPDARISRLDRDEANTANKLYRQLEAIRNHDVDIVIGTQLITKGHDFSNVTLVCVVNADQGLFSVDFRAPELMFQQLVQVAGRAGRASSSGEVLIQTGFPGHPYIQMIKGHDYQGFADAALLERAQAGYPPASHIALFRAESANNSEAIEFLRKVAQTGKNILAGGHFEPVEILSAVSSPMEKLAGRYRAQLMVRSTERGPMHHLIEIWLQQIENLKQARAVRWSLDIDPMDMY